MLSACIWSNFDPHRIHIYNIVISPLVMSANVYLQNYLTHASYTLVYVVVIAFDVLADVIKIVNYTLIKCTIAKRLSSFEWFFFLVWGGGGYVNKNTSLLLLSLLDPICLQVYSWVRTPWPIYTCDTPVYSKSLDDLV